MLYTHSTISEVNAALPVIVLEVSKSKGIRGLYMKLSGEVTTNMTLVLKSFTTHKNQSSVGTKVLTLCSLMGYI